MVSCNQSFLFKGIKLFEKGLSLLNIISHLQTLNFDKLLIKLIVG